MRRRALVALVLALVTIIAVAAPAFAGDAPPREGSGGRISVDGGLIVGDEERVDGLVVSIDGDVRIDGIVDNDVYVVSGDVRIFGRVRDDVLVIGGDATIIGGMDGDLVVIGGRAIVQNENAFVGGDIRSTDEPRVAKGAQVNGSVDKLGFNGMFGSLMFTLLAFLWLAVSISGAIVGLIFVLVFPRAAAASTRAGRQVPSSIAWGLGVGILGPVVAVVALASLVGLPLGLGLGAGLIALAGLGYVTSALCLGRTMIKATDTGGRIGAFFAGFGILRAIAIIPGIGGLVGFLATLYGLGVLANAAWRSSRSLSSPGDGAPAVPAPTVDHEPATELDLPAADDPTAVAADAGTETSGTTTEGNKNGG